MWPGWSLFFLDLRMPANRELAEVGEALIALHDGQSTGTRDIIQHVKSAGLPVHVVIVSG